MTSARLSKQSAHSKVLNLSHGRSSINVMHQRTVFRVYRAASDVGQPGDSACQVCSLNTASIYSILPSSSAAVWCLFHADKETKAPRAKSTELGFHPRPPYPGGSANCRCLGREGALIGPCRPQARGFQSPSKGLPEPLASPARSEAL